MAIYRTWSFDSDQLTGQANAIKDQVLGQLAVDGLFTDEQANELQARYAVIHTKPKWLNRWWQKWRKEDHWEYVLVKVDLEHWAPLEIREAEAGV